MEKKITVVLFLIIIVFCSLMLQKANAAELPPWPYGWSEEEVVTDKINYNSLDIELAFFGGKIYFFRAIGKLDEMDLGFYEYKAGQGSKLIKKFETDAFCVRYPQMRIDESGNKFFFWVEERRRKDFSRYYLFKYARMDKNNLLDIKPAVFFSSDSEIIDPGIFVSSDSHIHIIWAGAGNEGYDGFYTVLSKEGKVILPAKDIISGDYTFNRADIYVTPEGLIHLAWTQLEEDGEHLYYMVLDSSRNIISEPLDFGLVSLFEVTELNGNRIQLEPCFPELAGFDDRVLLVWNQIPEGSASRFTYNIYLNLFDLKGNSLGEKKALSNTYFMSSRPDITINGEQIAVVWQENYGNFTHVFFSELNRDGSIKEKPVRLDILKASSFKPRLVSDGNGEYFVFYNRVKEEGIYLSSKNTLFPVEPSVWYKLGLEGTQPWQSLVYVFITDLILSVFYTLPNLLLVVAGYLVLSLIIRLVGREWLDDNFILVCVFSFALLFLLLETPLFIFRIIEVPVNLKYINFVVASLVTLFFYWKLKKETRWSGLRAPMGRLLVLWTWLYFYIFMLSIPYYILTS